MSKKLIIVDVSNFIFRAFYAIRLLSSPEGVPVNAVYGVLTMLLKLLEQYRPTHVFLARDSKKKSFRSDIYPDYKANRDAPPEDLVPQFALVEELINKMELPSLQVDGYEADDIIGSAVTQWGPHFDEVLIVTGDKDIMQFVDEKVKIVDTMKDRLFGPKEVFEKMGVRPEQIVDYLSLVGDSSDHIPGVSGIGAKGACSLLAEYGTLESCLANRDKVANKRVKTALTEHSADALLSKKLVQIVTDLKLPLTEGDTEYFLRPNKELFDFLERLGFRSVLKKLNQLQTERTQPSPLETKPIGGESHCPVIVLDSEKIEDFFKKLSTSQEISFYPSYSTSDYFDCQLNSLAITLNNQDHYFFPFSRESKLRNHEEKILRKIWEDETKEVICYDVKEVILCLFVQNIEVKAKFFDVGQAHYVIDVASPHDLDYISTRYLKDEGPVLSEPLASFESLELQPLAHWYTTRSWALMLLSGIFKQEISKLNLQKVYFEIDLPLVPVLASMQKEGVRVNIPYLNELEDTFRRECKEIQKEIDKYSEGINLNSPKQVSFLLFEKLGLPIIKKTKTGASTDSEVLLELISRNLSDVPALIMRHRELEKLISTYVSVLPQLVNKKTGRIHTTFNQNVAATGRLSSDNPNLQNIPIRTPDGRKVRRSFIASPGSVLISVDYSQVELRLLAHFSGDQTMIRAFSEGQDIHAQTAAEVMNVPLDKVTKDERSRAKAVNFGLMYGQSSFGLSRSLQITRNEAKDYIEAYFTRFHKVKSYLDSLKEICEKRGYSETLFGRKRYLPDIKSQNRTVKSMAERIAVNSPIQGTAADIIKMAMIKLDQEFKKRKFKSKMLLQVHDELIFEVPENEVDQVKSLVVETMEGVVELKVPLKVDVGIGVNWCDLK